MLDLESCSCGDPLIPLGLDASPKASDSAPHVSACGVFLSLCQHPIQRSTLPGPPWDSPTPGACPLSFLLPCAESPADLGVEKLMMEDAQATQYLLLSLRWASGVQLLPVLHTEVQELPSCLVRGVCPLTGTTLMVTFLAVTG